MKLLQSVTITILVLVVFLITLYLYIQYKAAERAGTSPTTPTQIIQQ